VCWCNLWSPVLSDCMVSYPGERWCWKPFACLPSPKFPAEDHSWPGRMPAGGVPLAAILNSIVVPPLVPGCILEVLQNGNQPVVYVTVTGTQVASYQSIHLSSGVTEAVP